MVWMLIFGVDLPLWAFFIIGLVAVIIVWKLFKFAVKILLVIVVFFIILIGLDAFGVFDAIQNIFAIGV